ncbi:MAG: hypothetical protein JW862_01340 [Anaerolineales bacterium]|nr:hypothetical protein [Anaerolineales bacterium]
MNLIVDAGVVFFANFFNLLIAGIMIARVYGLKLLERNLGWLAVGLGLPFALALVYNLASGRPWWAWVLPLIFLLHTGIEFILDYWLKAPFRQTRWLGPYLGLFYLAQWGLIGYAFLVTERAGFTTLVTYFLSLAATAFSYARVRHG